MQASQNLFTFQRLGLTKQRNEVDKGTTRTTPGNNQGARPPREEDFDKIHEKNKKEKKGN